MWLATGVYGPTVHQNSIINGESDHYSRSPDAQKSLAESMQRLLFNEFFGTASENVADSQTFLEHFQRSSSNQIDDLKTFIKTRSSINENFHFWCKFLKTDGRHFIQSVIQCSGVARGGQGAMPPPKLLLNVLFRNEPMLLRGLNV